jgi:hypothetical protein
MVDKLKRASLPLAFSRVYDRFGPNASMRLSGGQTWTCTGFVPVF